jgi:hypothetical protein
MIAPRARRGDAGPMLAEVVEVGAERDDGAGRGRDGARDVHQLGLAQRAAIDGIVGVAGDLELVGLDEMMAIAEAELGAERAGVRDLGARHRRRDRGDRVAAIAEGLGRDGEQERRVDATRERDDDRGLDREAGAQVIELRCGTAHHR